MAKIAIDAREIDSGTGRYIECLLSCLQKIDKVNQYLVLLQPADMAKWEPTNSNFVRVACPHNKFTFDEQLGFKKQLKDLKPDLVHFCMAQQPILYRGKCVTTIHDLTGIRFKNPAKNAGIIWFKQQVYKFVIKRAAKKSEFVIAVSEYSKKDLVDFAGVKPTKVIVTYEAAHEILEPAEAVKNLRDKEFIFYVGRPQPHKNLKRLIEAFAEVKKTHPNLLLVLAGRKDSVYDSYFKEAQRLGVADSVIITGYITDAQKKWLFRRCRAYIFPSLSEGFGLPGLEAMLHRAPVVCSTLTSLPEIYGNAAWYFDPLDVNDMARCIGEVLDNKELRNKLILAGRKQAAKYSWEKTAKETLMVYEAALKG